MPLGRLRDPFSDAEWIFEIKWDGFRSLAYLENGNCQLVSRNGNPFKSSSTLASGLPLELRTNSVVLDGEIVCLDRHGKPGICCFGVASRAPVRLICSGVMARICDTGPDTTQSAVAFGNP